MLLSMKNLDNRHCLFADKLVSLQAKWGKAVQSTGYINNRVYQKKVW